MIALGGIDMTNEELLNFWRHLLVDLNISESEASRMLGQAPQSINSKVKRGTLRYIEVQTLLEKLGKTLTVITKQK